MLTDLCPDRQQLRDFVTGRLPESSLDEIAEHLETCDDCDANIATLDNESDSFINELKFPAGDESFINELEFHEAVSIVQAYESDAPRPSKRSSKNQQVGQYMLVERLGTGGMGTVYKALHTKLEKFVALKVLRTKRMLDDRAIARFEREMKAVGKLKHENIVQASDAGDADGKQYLVMEYVEGAEFSELIARSERLSIADACELVRQAAVGLQHAHEHGLVHRDMKPSNLMLAEDGSVKILDLGLAGFAGEQFTSASKCNTHTDRDDLTLDGQIMGTAEYIAPEQAENSHDVDIRADIYGLGCTLFALLVGAPPFRRQDFATPKQLINAHQTSARPPIADLPPKLARIIDRMLAIEPGDRFPTPAEVADALSPFTINADVSTLLSPKPKSTSESAAPKDTNSVDGRLWEGFLQKKVFVALAILAVIAFAAFGIVFKLKTPYGTVEIETDDKNVEVSVSQAGKEIDIINAASGWDIRLKEGKYDLSLKSGNDKFKLSNNTVTISRENKIVLRVTLKNTALVIPGDPFDGNVALSSRGATVEGPAYYPLNLLDGKTTGYHGTRGWAQSVTPATWTVTLPREYPLRQIRLLLYDRDSRAFRYTVETSVDGKKYEMVADHSEKWSKSWQILPCPGRPVRHIRVQCLDSTYNDRPREKGFFAIELKAYCYPPKPQRWFPGGPLFGKLEDLRRRSYMLEFSGKQAYVAIPKLRYDGSHPITFEAIVMSLYHGSIIANFSGAGLGLDVADGYCSFHVNDGREADNGYVRVKSSISVGRDKPIHIAGVLDGNKLRLFVDGKLQGSETIGEFNKSDFPFMIGADPGGEGEPTQFLNGIIDEVRVSRTARYDKDFWPPSQLSSDKQTLLLYRFDEGEGDVANDSSGNGLHGKIHSPKWVAAKAEPGAADSPVIQRLRQIGVKITEKNGVATGFTFGNSAKITDADLAMLESLSSLEDFTLVRCDNVTDAGFSHLKHLTRLQKLNLSPSNITDAGLANVKGMKDLSFLSLNSPGITDAGMVHLTQLSSLKHILLSNTQVTVAGLTHLSTLKNLEVLQLRNTQITPAEFEELRKLLPKDCEIKYSVVPPQQILPIEVPTPTTLPGHENHVNSAVFSPDGKTLAAGDYAGTVILWDLSTQRKLRLLNNIQPIECVVFSPDGKTLVTADRGSAITFWDVKTGREFKKIKEHTSAVMSVAYSPEGDMLASAGVDNTVKIWDSASGEVRATLSGHTNAVQEVKFSRDGRKLASIDLDGALRIWDPVAGELLSTYKVDRSGMGLAFSPNGKILATANYPPKIQLLDVATGRVLETLMGHKNRVRDVAFSPNGRVLASAGDDQTIRFWDIASGRQIGLFSGHTGRVHDVEFSPDGKSLASASADKTSKVWNVERFRSGK